MRAVWFIYNETEEKVSAVNLEGINIGIKPGMSLDDALDKIPETKRGLTSTVGANSKNKYSQPLRPGGESFTDYLTRFMFY